ncbi:MAG: hypothetical protein KAR42_16505 [candidate division Zixibacteria bacterium]|nr:hypothetical protein [candidate division Zixibacteria bacterium]
MCDQASADFTFDRHTKIIHISYQNDFHISNDSELRQYFSHVTEYLDTIKQYGELHIVVDISNFIIEPDLAGTYAELVDILTKKYLHKDGIARYGYQITRITLKRAYEEHLERNPNIFRTKSEAYKYIASISTTETNQDWIETTSSLMARPF